MPKKKHNFYIRLELPRTRENRKVRQQMLNEKEKFSIKMLRRKNPLPRN